MQLNPLSEAVGVNVLERNTIRSFNHAKQDIISLGIELAKIRQQVRETQALIAHRSEEPLANMRLHALDTRVAVLENKFDGVSALRKEVDVLSERYGELVSVTRQLLQTMEQKEAAATSVVLATPKVTKIVRINRQPRLVASTATMKVHSKNCPFGQNIARRNKVVFKTRGMAFKKGYKACNCLKR